jgi:glutathione S-transferase
MTRAGKSTGANVRGEKGVDYDLEPVSIMVGEGQAADHIGRHPFGKVPAFALDGFARYETGAICRYADTVPPGPSLRPTDARQAARMDQIIALVDSCASGAIVGKPVWQRLVVPMQGGTGDETIVQGAMAMVRLCLAELARLKGENTFLASAQVTLADCFVAPVFACLAMTPESSALLEPHAGLEAWWGAMSERSSVRNTPAQFG